MEVQALFAQMLAGVVAVPLLNLLKKLTGLSGVPMAWTALVASFVIGGVAAAVTGAFKLAPESIVQNGAIVFSVSQVVYRTLKDRIKF